MGGAACTGEVGIEFVRLFEDIDYIFSGCALISFPDSSATGSPAIARPATASPVCFRKPTPAMSRPALTFSGRNSTSMRTSCRTRGFPPGAGGGLSRRGRASQAALRNFARLRVGRAGALHVLRPERAATEPPAMTPENALAQIRSVLRHADACDFFAGVDNLMPAGYIEEVLPHIRMPVGHTLQYEVRPDLDEPQIQALCASGVRQIQPGVEALSTDTLRRMNKGATAFGNIRFLKACSRHPIQVGWNLPDLHPRRDGEHLPEVSRRFSRG